LTSNLHIARAARCIQAGGLVAYPTEAVFGLGCLPHDARAVARLLAVKQRSWRKGLLLIGASTDQVTDFAELPEDEPRRRELLASWPGAVTWVLPALPGVPRCITGGRPTVAVRVTDHPLARALCERVGSAIVSTSANVSRRPPLDRVLHVRREFRGAVDYVLPGPLGGLAKPTIIKDGRTGRVLRAA
jgi:L-threonylcarbamoyladenylate synthase